MRRLLAGALLVVACHRPAPATPSDGGSTTPSPAPPALGVQVALPEGWSFFPAADGSLRAGPRGRTAVRIDPTPAGTPLPNPDDLAHSFEGGLSGLSQQVLKTSQSSDSSTVVVALLHQRQGRGVQHRAFLGAKRLAGRVFLCASAPGDTASEVDQSATVCQGLSARPAPAAGP